MGLYGSQYDYVICVALITLSQVSLITSFQPPLLPNQLHDRWSYIMYMVTAYRQPPASTMAATPGPSCLLMAATPTMAATPMVAIPGPSCTC